MKATELRIGNYIYLSLLDEDRLDFKDVLFKVDANTIRDSVHYGNDWTGSPIPLTEEWLLKFGFKKGKVLTNIYYELNIDASYGASIVAFIENEKKLEIYLSDCDGGHIGKKLEYVHKLQNLYFALTGEELKIINP